MVTISAHWEQLKHTFIFCPNVYKMNFIKVFHNKELGL